MKQGVRYPAIRLAVILLAIFYIFPASSWGELKLNAAYPTLGLMDQNLDVTLKGTEFDTNTRVSMYLDSGNRMVLVGSVPTPGGSAFGVAASGNYVYVAARKRALCNRREYCVQSLDHRLNGYISDFFGF